MTTKGQIEAKISEIVTKFEVETMGRGPQEINTIINKDMIFIRQRGFLSPAEKNWQKIKTGLKLLKDLDRCYLKMRQSTLKKLLKR